MKNFGPRISDNNDMRGLFFERNPICFFYIFFTCFCLWNLHVGVTFNPEVKDMKPMWNVIAEQKMQNSDLQSFLYMAGKRKRRF